MITNQEFLDRAIDLKEKHSGLFGIIESYGIRLEYTPFHGCLNGYFSPTRNAIVLEKTLKGKKREFVLGHEIGEVVFWREFNNLPMTLQEKEELCDQFAEVLVGYNRAHIG